jgi:U2 small nuclear ribonucleoprotein B''
MKQSLKVLFKEYGNVLGVTAHRNLRMRGQAFVTLDTKEAAVKAVQEVQKFPLYGKPMVRSAFSFFLFHY